MDSPAKVLYLHSLFMSLDLSVSLTSSAAVPSNTSDFRVWWLHTRNTSLLKGVTILQGANRWDIWVTNLRFYRFLHLGSVSSITVSRLVTLYRAPFPPFSFCCFRNYKLQSKNKHILVSHLKPPDLCGRYYINQSSCYGYGQEEGQQVFIIITMRVIQLACSTASTEKQQQHMHRHKGFNSDCIPQ